MLRMMSEEDSQVPVWSYRVNLDKRVRSDHPGILTAEDVSTLDLQGTWLVTLSACDTGSGEARAGEGVMAYEGALSKPARRIS